MADFNTTSDSSGRAPVGQPVQFVPIYAPDETRGSKLNTEEGAASGEGQTSAGADQTLSTGDNATSGPQRPTTKVLPPPAAPTARPTTDTVAAGPKPPSPDEAQVDKLDTEQTVASGVSSESTDGSGADQTRDTGDDVVAGPQGPTMLIFPPPVAPTSPPTTDEAAAGPEPAPHSQETFSLYDHIPTITPNSHLDPEWLSLNIKKAMNADTNKNFILRELTSMTNDQRQVVSAQYKKMYGKPMIEDLQDSLGGKLEKAVEALMYLPASYDARTIHDAIRGFSTNEAIVAEILATRNKEQILRIKMEYEHLYDKNLEEDIDNKTSGHLKRIFRSLLSGDRESNVVVDRDKARRDAKMLYESGEKKRWGTDESTFNRVFMTSSDEQLQLVSEEYLKISDYTLEHAIERELSGDLQCTYLVLLQRGKNIPKFFANRLHSALISFRTDYDTAIRVAVSRSEIDLGNIKEAYTEHYGEKVSHTVDKKTRGEEFKTFMSLIFKEHTGSVVAA